MNPDKEFIRAWFTWKRQARPTDAFESGKRHAPEYSLECELDHLATWVYELGMAHLSGSGRDYRTQSAELSREMHDLAIRVQDLPLSPSQGQNYLGYLQHMQQVVNSLGACHKSDTDQEP